MSESAPAAPAPAPAAPVTVVTAEGVSPIMFYTALALLVLAAGYAIYQKSAQKKQKEVLL